MNSGHVTRGREGAYWSAVTESESDAVSRLLRGDGVHSKRQCKSTFEEDARVLFRIMDVDYLYEPVVFPVALPKKHVQESLTYSPDFFTGMTLNRRLVLIEAKGEERVSKEMMEKYATFMDLYGARYHFIVITNKPEAELNAMIEKTGARRFADEIWSTERRSWLRRPENGLTLEAVFIAGKISELRHREGFQKLRYLEPRYLAKWLSPESFSRGAATASA